MMELTLLVLKDQTTLVAQTEQLPEEPRVHLLQPMKLSGKTKLSLQPWPEYAADIHILLHSDSLLTVCDPNVEVRAAYLKKIGKTEEDFQKQPQPVLLNEDEGAPDYDDYEPNYQEI